MISVKIEKRTIREYGIIAYSRWPLNNGLWNLSSPEYGWNDSIREIAIVNDNGNVYKLSADDTLQAFRVGALCHCGDCLCCLIRKEILHPSTRCESCDSAINESEIHLMSDGTLV